jgi:hypothetical protein
MFAVLGNEAALACLSKKAGALGSAVIKAPGYLFKWFFVATSL